MNKHEKKCNYKSIKRKWVKNITWLISIFKEFLEVWTTPSDITSFCYISLHSYWPHFRFYPMYETT